MQKRILITGAAGFIGSHVARHLKARGDFVIGVDHFNAYYSPALKYARQALLAKHDIFIHTADICNQPFLESLLTEHNISHVVHLAAQAGVRHSLSAPNDYVSSNLQGFVSLLEACKNTHVRYLVYASSSSVYGLNEKTPFSVSDATDRPANLYGATKKANEAIAYAYHHLYGICVTGLRYFTAYGPWGRPDMAYFSFAEKICAGQPIQVFNHGRMKRDFTYIDDIVNGTIAAIDFEAPCEIFNLGNNHPIELLHIISLLEQALGKSAKLEMLPMQMGEVLETCADISKSQALLGFNPSIPIEEGLARFVNWHQEQGTLLTP